MNKVLNVAHLGDFQVECRNSGNGNRHDEMKLTLERTIESLRLQVIDIIVIPGDLIEFADTTTTENDILQWFLHELSIISPVVITLGNHDCAQRAVITKDYKVVSKPSQVQVTVDTMRNPRVKLLQRSGFHEAFGETFVVWSHWEKYNKDLNDQLTFDPWQHENAQQYVNMIAEGKRVIELYHDPISNAKGWDGNPNKIFSEHSIGLHSFKANTILAADIHYPDMIWFDKDQKRLFTYCSSTVMRNFGEGNYYSNANLYQAGNKKHGYNKIEIDEAGFTTKIDFVPIAPAIGRHTIAIDSTFTYDQIELLNIVPETFNIIRLVVEDNIVEFLNNHEEIVKHFKSKYHCMLEEPVFDKNIGLDFEDGLDITDASKLADEDTINELAITYIEATVDGIKSMAAEDKPVAKEMLINMFKEQLAINLDKNSKSNRIELCSIMINNSLTFGNDVFVDFDSKGITRITGSNATGKTKIFTIVGWMLTDQLIHGQSMRNVRDNRLDIFNYKLPQDWLENELVFKINGKKHILRKRLERKWKKNESKWSTPEWRDFISETPAMEIELQSDAFTSTNYDEIMKYLNEIVTFDDFYMYVFINQFSLEKLLHMNSDHLIANILKIVGLDVFDALNEKYEIFKSSTLNGLVNPTGTVEAYVQENAELQQVLDESETMIEGKNGEIKILKDASEKDNEKILELTREIGSAKRVSEVEEFIRTFEQDIISRNAELVTLNQNRSDEQVKYDAIDEELVKKRTQEIRDAIRIKENGKALKENEQTNLKDVHVTVKGEIDAYNNAKRAELDAKVANKKIETSKIETEVTAQRSLLTDITNQVTERKNELVSLNQIEINKLDEAYQSHKDAVTAIEKELTRHQTLAASYKIQFDDLTIKIDKNEKAMTCPTCLRQLDEDAIEAINGVIAADRQKRSEIEYAIDGTKAFVDDFQNKFNQGVIVRDEAFRILSEAKLVEIKLTLNDCPDLLEQATAIAKVIAAKNASITALNEEIKTINEDFGYKQDEYVTSRMTRIANLSNEELEITTTIDQFKKEIDTLNGAIEANDALLKSKQASLDAVREYERQIGEKTIRIEQLTTTLESHKSDLVIAKTADAKYLQIDEFKLLIKNRSTAIDEIFEAIQTIKTKVTTGTSAIQSNNNKIQQLKQWWLTNAVLRQYKIMLSNTGLQRYIFTKIVDIINSKLNDLLQDVDFRLYFDKETLRLKMLDLSTNISSTVSLTSGMETSVLGLGLLYSTMILNRTRSFNFIMIDEISGQLNSGKDLTYEAKNYQLLLVNLIRKIAKTHDIYIVDHVLETLGEHRAIEVQKTKNGSLVRELRYDEA